MPLRIVLADDHPTFVAGLEAYLARQPDLGVIGVAEDGPRALALARRERPDVLVLDLEMPRQSGLDVVRALSADGLTGEGGIQVLILSAYEEADYLLGALDAGAAGYLTKQEPLSTIRDAIRGVGAGETDWLSRRLARVFAAHRRPEPSALDAAEVSPRERDVLLLMARGLSNEGIAERLFISAHTVKKHVVRLYEKLGVSTRAQAVVWVWERGLAGEPVATGNS